MAKIRNYDKCKFPLPADLTEIDISMFPPVNEELIYQAQDIAYDAMQARTVKKELELAQKALSVSPWCVEAWRIIADHQKDLQKAIQLYRVALEIGKAALGRDFDEMKGEFWGFHETRPYMRAKAALADALEKTGDINGAIAEYQEMLELNPNDNQGIRDVLLPLLLQANRDKEAAKLLKQYEEKSAFWLYGKALLEFRKRGEGKAAATALQNAVKNNPYGIKYLSGKKKMPKTLPGMYRMKSEEEAVYLALYQKGAWDATAGAIEWLLEKLAALKMAK